MYNLAPKYKKIEIILNKTKVEKPNVYEYVTSVAKKEEDEIKIKKINDPFFQTKEKITFNNAALVVTGGYILITQEHNDDGEGNGRSSTGRIFDLNDVFSYRAYFEEN